MNFCPHCGAKVQDPDSLFCTECGQKMPPKMQSFIAAAQSAAEASFDADSPAPALGGDVSSTDAPTEGAAWQPTQNLFAQADDDAPRGDEATAQFAAVTPGVSGTDDAPAPPPPAPEPEPPAPEPEPPAPEAATQPTAPPAQAVTLFEEEDGSDAAPTLFDPEEAPLARPAAPVEKEAPAVPAAPPAGDAAASGEDLLGMIAAAQGEAPAPKQQYTAPAPGAPDLFSQPARQTPSLFEEADTQYIPDPFAEQALG
ncbi:zinc ribbon domain-containing protein, partial [Ruminococcaceae bacterium OttesenSCG-928-O06]|nr:zinc ribbon domain-containing protein [Ruminococcaceae bacterium OttesenSCG-928-O06]